MKPLLLPWQAWFFNETTVAEATERLLKEIEWESRRDARKEYFMYSDPETFWAVAGETYTYGKPPHETTYVSKQWHPLVTEIMHDLNEDFDIAEGTSVRLATSSSNCAYNVCFLNRYDDEKNQLGWHSDDTPGMLHEHPIGVVSFGEPREIWVREKGASGVVPKEDRYLLTSGSLFIMPPTFQLTHQHRIPKGDRRMGPRVSLTYRRYVP